MKKSASILMAAVMFAAMLTVFALPAGALDQYNVGQWVKLTAGSSIKKKQQTYSCVIGIISSNKYCVAHYIYDIGSKEVIETDTDTLSPNNISALSSEYVMDIPDCVKEKAVQDIENYNASASTLSEGNMTIVCTVAAAVVFGLGGFLLGRKKKPTAVTEE